MQAQSLHLNGLDIEEMKKNKLKSARARAVQKKTTQGERQNCYSKQNNCEVQSVPGT